MILIAVLIGVILVVAAIRDTGGALFAALGTDVPGYVVWAAAIVALGAIGFVPDLKPISKGLLALVIIVIVLRNYQQIIAGFQAAAQPAAPSTPATSNVSATPSAVAPASAASAPAATNVQPIQSVTQATPSTNSSSPAVLSPFGDVIDNLGSNFNGNTANWTPAQLLSAWGQFQ